MIYILIYIVIFLLTWRFLFIIHKKDWLQSFGYYRVRDRNFGLIWGFCGGLLWPAGLIAGFILWFTEIYPGTHGKNRLLEGKLPPWMKE